MSRLLSVICLILLIGSCNRGLERQFMTTMLVDEELIRPSGYNNLGHCGDKLAYAPDLDFPEHTPTKTIRLNFHIMCKEDGSSNFDKEKGRLFINQVLEAANDKLGRNSQMRLPLGNATPVLPIGYRYKLTPRPNVPGDEGIYFHYDDELYYMLSEGKSRNNYDRTVFNKYGIQKDTVMNVFVMTHPVDSLKSPKFNPHNKTNGIAFGSWLKVNGWFFNVQDTVWRNGKMSLPKGKWFCQKLLNHEVGHCLGLRHSWRSNDGCDDTPKHPNCWGKSKRPPCDSLWSNNFMDYNTHASAWSPCQIGTVHYNFSSKKRKIRRLLERTWCTLKEDQTIYIDTTVVWKSAKDLEGHIIIRDGGSLTVNCRVALPKGAKISVYPEGELLLNGAVLENDCGENWEGIEILRKDKKEGVVQMLNSSKILNTTNSIEIKAKAKES
ncbi:MAG: hypothetical protein AAGG75_26715 [Bacteroidota bacterium]